MGVNTQPIEESKENLYSRKLDKYEESMRKNTLTFSRLAPKDIFDLLESKLLDKDVTAELNDKKWKLTFKRVKLLDESENELGLQPEWCEVQVKLMQMPNDERMICVEFTRKGGSSLYFYE